VTKNHLIFLLVVLPFLCGATSATAQCERSISISERVFLRCNGKTYTNCIVHLIVNEKGLWVNGDLAKPFIPFVDRLSPTKLKFYRSRQYYLQKVESGKSDREALIATTLAELEAQRAFKKMTQDFQTEQEMQENRIEVLSDPLIADFISDIRWEGNVCRATYKPARHQPSVVSIQSGFVDQRPNIRAWGEYLPYLIETNCKLLRTLSKMEQNPGPGRFEGYSIERGFGHFSTTSKDKLYEWLDRH